MGVAFIRPVLGPEACSLFREHVPKAIAKSPIGSLGQARAGLVHLPTYGPLVAVPE